MFDAAGVDMGRSPKYYDGSQDAATNEAHMISEATQVATVAARSILASGGSQATALKTAKAAAKSTLLGTKKHRFGSDDVSVASQYTSGSLTTWAQKRKVKRQAEIVASMALAAASNSVERGFEKPSGEDVPYLMSKPPVPASVQGGQTPTTAMASNDSASAFFGRKPPLVPSSPPITQKTVFDTPAPGKAPPLSPTASYKSKQSSTTGSNKSKQSPTVMEEAVSPPIPSSPIPVALPMPPSPANPKTPKRPVPSPVQAPTPKSTTKSAPAVQATDVAQLAASSTLSSTQSPPKADNNNDKDISAVDLNCEDPIYWGTPREKKEEARPVVTEQQPAASMSMGNSTFGDASSGDNMNTKNLSIVYDSISDDSEDYSEDETLDGTLDGMEDLNAGDEYQGNAVERGLDPFFDSFGNMFACSCSCSNPDKQEKTTETEIQEPLEQEVRDEVVEGGDASTKSGSKESETREHPSVREARQAPEAPVSQDSGEVYHTIVLKSRYDPGEESDVEVDNLEPTEDGKHVEEPTVLPVQQDKRKKQEKSGSKRKKGNLFRRKRGSQGRHF